MAESAESVELVVNGDPDHGTAGSTEPNTEPLVTLDTLAEREKEKERPTCRICLDDEESKSLIRPCHCRGTMQYIHIECLDAWRKSAAKQSIRGGIACEQCKFEYVDAVQWRRPLWTAIAPVASGIAGGVLQVLPIGVVLLWHFIHGAEGPHNFCTRPKMGPKHLTEVKIVARFWEQLLRLILLSPEPGEPASGYPTTSSSAIIEPIPLLECITPRIVTGFLAALLVSVYHLALRAARTAYPPLRLAHAALLEPAQGLSAVWSLRSGMITYELLRCFFLLYLCDDVRR
ncbi:hypothetical protein M407DRAFT_166160 [Tulasnella calospora MUT 4182]|uniref:RING-CH-type domain-containing protein n=1 Tax=Tulasnella calospora MUT 4182 TaxID=1051891 RepID=A0A0C3QM45_9AGAM|nr:hypothetical protein M407DRAFT_166160 [Tulasnella calospora MUT 4182]